MRVPSSESPGQDLPRQGLIGRAIQALVTLVRGFPQPVRAVRCRSSPGDNLVAFLNQGLQNLEDEESDWVARRLALGPEIRPNEILIASPFDRLDMMRRVAKALRCELGKNRHRTFQSLEVAGGGLAPEDLEALLARISPDREQAITLYEDIRHWLMGFFRWQLRSGSENLVDEAIERAIRLLSQGTTIPRKWPFSYLRFRVEAERMAVEMYLEAMLKDQVLDTSRRRACLLDCLLPRYRSPEGIAGIKLLLLRTVSDPGGLEEAELSHEHLEALLTRLSPDRELAGVLYEEIRRRLIGLFEKWQLGVSSDSLADKTIDRVARRLAQGKIIHIEKPFGYFWGVAYRLALEMYRQAKRQDQAIDTFAALHRPEPEPEADPHLPCLQKCLGRLSASERQLIFRYFEEEDRITGRQRLAKELGIGRNALRIRAHRVRRKLAGCCAQCLEAEAHGYDAADLSSIAEA